MRLCLRNLTNQFKSNKEVWLFHFGKVYDSNYNLKSFTTSSNGKRDFGRKCN